MKKEIKIDDETVKQTTKCPYNFQCLSDPDFEFCPIKESLGIDILVLKNPKYRSCPYLLCYDDNHICNCPTRCEIYEKYRK